MSEKDIILDLRDGSYKAFGLLYESYARKLYSFCLAYSKSEEDSADIVQDVFEKIWKNRATLNPELPVKPLLFTIAKNELINAYKKTLNSKAYKEYISNKSYFHQTEERKIEYKDYIRHVTRTIRLLPNTQQRVLYLSRFEGLSIKEISAQLHLTEETVRNQISLGTKQLKLLLGKTGLLAMAITGWLNFL